MMEMRECKLFFGNLSVCEQLSRREKAGKLECSKNIKSGCVFKDVRVLLLKEPILSLRRERCFERIGARGLGPMGQFFQKTFKSMVRVSGQE